MPTGAARANAAKSAIRARIEHGSARQKGQMALFIRTIGIARAEAKITLACNLDRLVFHDRHAAMGWPRPAKVLSGHRPPEAPPSSRHKGAARARHTPAGTSDMSMGVSRCLAATRMPSNDMAAAPSGDPGNGRRIWINSRQTC